MWTGGYLVLSFINPLNCGCPVKMRTEAEPSVPYFYTFCNLLLRPSSDEIQQWVVSGNRSSAAVWAGEPARPLKSQLVDQQSLLETHYSQAQSSGNITFHWGDFFLFYILSKWNDHFCSDCSCPADLCQRSHAVSIAIIDIPHKKLFLDIPGMHLVKWTGPYRPAVRSSKLR